MAKKKGRGWHGNSAGHAAAARKGAKRRAKNIAKAGTKVTNKKGQTTTYGKLFGRVGGKNQRYQGTKFKGQLYDKKTRKYVSEAAVIKKMGW